MITLFTGDTRPFYVQFRGEIPFEDTGDLSAVFLDNNGLGPITNVVPMPNHLPLADWGRGKFAFSFPPEETVKLNDWHNKAVVLEFSFTDGGGKRSWQIMVNIKRGNT